MIENRGKGQSKKAAKGAPELFAKLGADLSEDLPDEMDLELDEGVEEPRIYTVSEISSDLRESLKEQFSEIMLQGEVADYKGVHRSGHLYFALKDATAQIKAVMWKGSLQRVPFEIKQGLEVIVTGKLDYYAGSGSLQMICESMQPVGIGSLQLKLEQLKEKLKAEGLFEAARKRKVSPINWRIGIVTSKTTAALQDMLKIYRSRFSLAEIFVFHAAVQGEKAPAEIVSAIEKAGRFSEGSTKALDVLVVTRGGGSYEDLFCFNDEKVVRAIAASKIPVVSAVGHEIDTTLADYVADKRSATPSHAAQETVPELRLWLERLEELRAMFISRMHDCLSDERQKLDVIYNRMVAAAPQKKIALQKDLLREKETRLKNAIERALEKRKNQLQRAASVLDALSPLKVLDRGYSIVSHGEKVIRSHSELKAGDEVDLRFSKGQSRARVL